MHCLAAAGAATPQLGNLFPLWSVVPFVAMLLAIAVLPLVIGKHWEPNLNKAMLSALLGAPVAIWTATLEPAAVVHAGGEYLAFILLLGALFVISGGIVIRGTLAGTPGENAIVLGIGAVLASIIGTTGASMLLIRPLVRANSIRMRKAHVFVFSSSSSPTAGACSRRWATRPCSSDSSAASRSPGLCGCGRSGSSPTAPC